MTMSDTRFPWRIFWVLLGAAVVGYVGVLPYAFEVLAKMIELRELPMSVPVFVFMQSLQSLIIFGLVVGFGLLLARKVGIETPFLRTWLYGERNSGAGRAFGASAIVGVVTGAVSLALFYGIFARHLPAWPSEANVAIWKRLLACFYGAVDEELLLRLFLLALVLWIAGKLTGTKARAALITFSVSNLVVALIFGAAHLPAAASLMPLTPVVVFVIVLLNAGAGAVFGYLAWTRGLEAAMLAHFSADLLLHLVGPLFAAT